MEISDSLKQSGLNEKQAQVYLALLELGTATVQPIAAKAGIKRPTTYLILDELKMKGLVSVVPRAKKALYAAESPEKLVSDLYKKQEIIKRFMPNLMALYNVKIEKPQVQLYEGEQGMRELYKKVFASQSVDFFCTISDVLGIFPEMPENLRLNALSKKIKVRELLTQDEADIAHARKMDQHEFYQNKFLAKGMKFLTDNVIFGNNIAFFSYHPYLFGVVISSKEICQSMRMIFETAWQAAENYGQVIK